MTEELKPCAFCGEYDGECAVSGVPNHEGKRKFAVYCNGCFSEGPPGVTEEDAIEAWNTRAAPSQPEGAEPAEREQRFVCSDCKAPLRHGYTCDACGSDRADEDEPSESAGAAAPDEGEAIQQIKHALTLLGPEAPECSGCEYEWNHAIKSLQLALAALSAPKGEEPSHG